MNYKKFCELVFSKYPLSAVQPIREGKKIIGAAGIAINAGKCVAMWVPRKGIVWCTKDFEARPAQQM